MENIQDSILIIPEIHPDPKPEIPKEDIFQLEELKSSGGIDEIAASDIQFKWSANSNSFI